MHRKLNKETIFSIIILSNLIVFLFIIYYSKRNFISNSILDNSSINISISRLEKVLNKNITNRVLIKKDNIIYIGENQKQIDNGYNDVKIHIKNGEGLEICINKLWKNFNKNLYEEDYIKEISKAIVDILDFNYKQEDIEKYVLSGYLLAKSEKDNNDVFEEIKTNDYKIKGKSLNKEFYMTIYKIKR